jgi:ribonuclease-3
MEIPNFKNKNLLRQALTHRSYINENPSLQDEGNNERLEFLGDALLNFLSGEYLYEYYPEMNEDQMTRGRAALVDEKQLAFFARKISLDLKMRLGKGVIYDGGFTNPNLQSSTFEAFIGAYYLDNDCDIEPVRKFVRKLFDAVPNQILETRSNVDAKNRFQHWVQTHLGQVKIAYLTKQIAGTEHNPVFLATAFVEKKKFGEGKGRNKKEAEKQAAENALKKLNSN